MKSYTDEKLLNIFSSILKSLLYRDDPDLMPENIEDGELEYFIEILERRLNMDTKNET